MNNYTKFIFLTNKPQQLCSDTKKRKLVHQIIRRYKGSAFHGPIQKPCMHLHMTQCKLSPTFKFQGAFGHFFLHGRHFCTLICLTLMSSETYGTRKMWDWKNVMSTNDCRVEWQKMGAKQGIK